MTPRWTVERAEGSARGLHTRGVPEQPWRAVTVLDVTAPALVLGSAQPEGDVDGAACAAAGVEIVRRRSGGGAVLLARRQVVWTDVVIPAGDPLWHDDVGAAFVWLGRAWADALRSTAPSGATIEVHTGGLVRNEWSRRVCFAGLGPGEVTMDGRKVVGISQRRTRAGALFQCAVHIAPAPGAVPDLARIVDLLALDAGERRRARAHLEAFVTAVDADETTLVSALEAALP